MRNVLILGTGPAGLTAAIYAARAGWAPLVLAGLQPGGQLTTTTEVENFPGFPSGIAGPKLMQDMTAQAERVGVELVYREAQSLALDPVTGCFIVVADGGTAWTARTVIVAMGAAAKTLGLEREWELMGRGLSTCATCDGFFFRDQDVAVVGGGDSAMEEALYLAKLCRTVTLVHRRESFRASQIMVDRVRAHPKIRFKTPWEVVELIPRGGELAAVRLADVQTGEQETLELKGLFYGIGHTPNSRLLGELVDRDAAGYVQVQNFTQTRTPGLFAAGDIADPTFKQAITAAGMGCQAALQAGRYLEERGVGVGQGEA